MNPRLSEIFSQLPKEKQEWLVRELPIVYFPYQSEEEAKPSIPRLPGTVLSEVT